MATGVQLQDRVDVQALLQTAVVVPDTLKKAAYFVDSTEIPVDRRFVEVTRSDYADTFDSSGYPYIASGLHFSQKRVPESFQVARWIQSASSPYWYSEGYSQTLASWQAVTDGEFSVTDGTNTENVTGIDFSSITALSQVPTVLTAAFAALLTPSVVGLDDAVASFDVYNRLSIVMPGTGASAVTIDLETYAGSGTDLTTLMDITNGAAVAGYDAESIADAVDALRPIDDTATFYTAKFTTASDSARATEILSLAAKTETLNKFALITADDTDIKNSAVTDDIFSQLQDLNYKRTMGIYFENISDRPQIISEVALLGAVIPADEGTVSFAYEDLTGVAASGYATALSKTLTDVVTGKGGTVIEQLSGFTHNYNGLTFGGEELRIMVGRDWFTNTIASNWLSYKMQQPLTAFDNETLTALEGVIREAGEEAIDRKILVDTAERPFTITLPDEDDFTQAERASRQMDLEDAFQAYLNSAVTDTQIIGTWTI